MKVNGFLFKRIVDKYAPNAFNKITGEGDYVIYLSIYNSSYIYLHVLSTNIIYEIDSEKDIMVKENLDSLIQAYERVYYKS